MFIKSIVVALILCACYLSAIQALDTLDAADATVHTLKAAQVLTQNVPIGGKPGGGPVSDVLSISNLPLVPGATGMLTH